MLPLKWLLERLENEEKQLLKTFPDLKFTIENFYDTSKETGRYMKVPTPVGIDEVEVIRVYKFKKLYAKAFAKIRSVIERVFYHDFDLYILRSYPLGSSTLKNPLKKPLYEAPIRIRYMSNIFHPNILPGPDFIDDEYAGAVCWTIYSNWLTSFTLDKIVQSFKMLIENPNPDVREALKRPICQEAAMFFAGAVLHPISERKEVRKPIVRGVV